jgi:putative transposase
MSNCDATLGRCSGSSQRRRNAGLRRGIGASDAGSRAHDISIPPKYAVWYIKGKRAIHLARVYGERKRSFVGQHFWARGYYVSTVGRDEQAIREYIKNQEQEDMRLEQMNLWR